MLIQKAKLKKLIFKSALVFLIFQTIFTPLTPAIVLAVEILPAEEEIVLPTNLEAEVSLTPLPDPEQLSPDALSVDKTLAASMTSSFSSVGGDFVPAHNITAAPINYAYLYSTSLFSGSSNYSVPITVPPATNGLAPQVAISYSSGAVNSADTIVGGGWNLFTGYIARDIKDSAYDTSDDTFTLVFPGGTDELVFVDNKWQSRNKSNLSIAYIDNTGSPLGKAWEVVDGAGNTYRFGFSDGSEAKCGFDEKNYVWRWYLDEIEDVHGNSIYFNYASDTSVAFNTFTYPTSIEYNNDRTRKVIFNYADVSNPQKYHDNGCKLEVTKYLENIQTKVDNTLVKQYDLSYSTNAPASTRRLLQNVTEKGSDGSSLPPTQFEYNNSEVNWGDQVITSNIEDGPFLNDANVVLNDVNADSRVDIVRSNLNGFYNIWFGNGNGWDTQKHNLVDAGNWKLGENNGVIFTDMNGDGFSDLARSNSTNLEVRINSNGSSFAVPQVWKYGQSLAHDMGDFNILNPRVSLTDVNADGYLDFFKFENNIAQVRTGSGLDNNNYRFEDSREWSRAAPDLEEPSHGIRVIDVTGDGLADIVKAHLVAGQYRYDVYYNEGDHWREDADTWVDNINWDLRAHKIQLVDVNSDGLVDLLEGAGRNWSIRFNTGSSWTNQAYAKSGNYDMNLDDGNVNLADVNGDNLPDIIKSEGATWKHHPHVAQAPGLLKTITTPYGGKTEIEYQSSSQLDNTGNDNINDLRFSTWVVSKMTKDNGVSGEHSSITEENYAYKNGKYNYVYGHDNRGFRGFGEVTVTSPTGNTNTTYFHQDDQRWGKSYKTEFKDDQGTLLSSSEQDWSASDTNGIYESLLQSQTDKLYNSSGQFKTTKQDYQYDSYQNPTLVHDYADLDDLSDDKYTYQEYVYNTSDNLVSGFAKHSYLLDSDNTTKLSENWTYYDNNISVDDTPSRGLVTKTETWKDNGSNPINQFEYDSLGNLTKSIDALNQESRVEYDVATSTFPIKQINPLLHEIVTSYDAGTGNVLTVTDANNITTSFEYDAFGRKTAEILPYDSAAFPTRTYDYYYQDNKPYTVLTGQRLNSGTSDMVYTAVISDGFDRELQSKVSAPAAGSYLTINTFYDQEGRAYKSSLPYYSTDLSYTNPDTSIAATTISYDSLSRPISTSYPDGSSSNISYNLWQQTLTDANNHSVDHTLNASGQITQITEHNGAENYTTTYDYTGRGELEKITDHYNNTFDWTYNSLGQKLSYSDVGSKVTSYDYDALGRLVGETDPNNTLTQTEYDALSRITKIDYPTQDDVTYTYDTVKKGTLAGKSYGQLTYSYDYDDKYRLTSETRTFAAESATKTYSYNAMDLLSGSSVTDYFSKAYSFASNGEIKSLADNSTADVLSNIDYNQHGKVTGMDFANGVSTAYSYDNLSTRLERILTGSISTNLFDTTYTYDAIGNVNSISDNKNNKTQNFIYDALDRLLRVNKAQAANIDTYNYSYDAIGNMTTAVKDNDQLTTYNYAEGAYSPQQLTSLTVAASTLNQAPYFNSTPNKQISEGETFSYGISAIDPESEAVSLSIVEAPEGAELIANTLTWTVPAAGASEEFFLLAATDIHGNSSNQGFYLNIGDIQMAPVISSSPVLEVADNENYSYQVTASDGDNDILSYSLLRAPTGMSIDSQSGLVSWAHDAASHIPGEYLIEIQVSDGVLTDSQSYNLTIYAGALESFTSIQNFTTYGSGGMEHFVINGEDYLAVAQNHDNGSDVTQLSEIRKWNGSSFDIIQTISSHGNFDWDFAEIAGEYYLAHVHHFGHRVEIFKWNGSQFVSHQDIAVGNSPFEAHSFEIAGDRYMAVANVGDSFSTVYKWNSTSSQYESFQTFTSYAATDWESFQIGGEYYLALANSYQNGWTADSQIYKWNGSNFETYQSYSADGTYDLEFFEFDGREFLALASMTYGDHIDNSRVLEWNGNQFVDFQVFTNTQSAFDMEYFKVGTDHYLAKISHEYGPNAGPTNSYIYKWDGSQFAIFEEINTHSATDGDHFVIDGVDYLAIATFYYNGWVTDSYIYEANYNDRPVFSSTPITQTQAENTYLYDVDAADSQTLTYSLAIAPAGMSINSETGVITWQPAVGDIASHAVSVQVTDGSHTVNQDYSLEVIANVNDAPVITSTAITTATENQIYNYDAEVTDPDINDTHSFSLISSPAGMSIDVNTGLISWTPGSSELGDHAVTVQVSDGSLTDTQSFTLTVKENKLLVNFTEHQSITTKGASDTEYFEIGTDKFLAVTHFYDGSSFNHNSEIRKWNGTSFEILQTIPTNGAIDWDFTTINNQHYLLAANYAGHRTDVYQWNGSSFALHHSLAGGNKPYEVDSFIMGSDHYLAITHYEANTQVYKWNGSTYAHVQTLASNQAADLEVFTINGDHYIAIAIVGVGNTITNSPIYKWDGSQFTFLQNISKYSALDVEYFQANDQHYLIYGFHGDNDHYGDSEIYTFNGSSFQLAQSLPDSATYDFEHITTVGAEEILLRARYNDGTADGDPDITLKWDGNQFTNHFTFGSNSRSTDIDHFVIDDVDYISVANYYSVTGYVTQSRIYKAVYNTDLPVGGLATLQVNQEEKPLPISTWSKVTGKVSAMFGRNDKKSEGVSPYLLEVPKPNIFKRIWKGTSNIVENTVDTVQNILPTSLTSSELATTQSLSAPITMSAITALVVPNNPFTTAASFTYDNNGNLLSDGKQSYAYNQANRMISVTDIATSNLVAEYIYDDAGTRAIEKIYTNGVLAKTTYKLFPDYEREIYADASPSKETYYYYANNQLVARDERVSAANTRYYYHSDHLGSTSLITDSAGLLVEETEYRPYGGISTGGTKAKHLYTGQEYDHSTGLNYYKSRYYQPHIQRFIQPDSIIPDAYDPQQLNPYAYVRNNPVKYVDPMGFAADATYNSNEDTIYITSSIELYQDGSEFDLEKRAKEWEKGMNEHLNKNNPTHQGRKVVYKVDVMAGTSDCGLAMNCMRVVGSTGSFSSAEANESTVAYMFISKNMDRGETLFGAKSTAIAHEFGHMAGIEDAYEKGIFRYGETTYQYGPKSKYRERCNFDRNCLMMNDDYPDNNLAQHEVDGMIPLSIRAQVIFDKIGDGSYFFGNK